LVYDLLALPPSTKIVDALHGFVPGTWIESNHGKLMINGLPIGTRLTFYLSTVAASFPEFILLKSCNGDF
jgi:hypothetical protein